MYKLFNLFKKVEAGWEYLPPPPEIQTQDEGISLVNEKTAETNTPHRLEKTVQGGCSILKETE